MQPMHCPSKQIVARLFSWKPENTNTFHSDSMGTCQIELAVTHHYDTVHIGDV